MEKISILLPTRGRSFLCIKSIESLFTLCNNKNNFEVLIAVDEDDTQHTKVLIDKYSLTDNIIIKIYKRFSYKYFHNYMNELCKISKGTSLFLWNDDAVMQSKNWDLEILKNHKNFCVLNPLVSNMTYYCRTNNQMLFPIIPKKWFELTGRWSNNAACDSWIEHISRDLGISVYLDSVVLHHNRFDLTGENNDLVFKESRKDLIDFVSNDFMAEYQIEERKKDLILIKNSIDLL